MNLSAYLKVLNPSRLNALAEATGTKPVYLRQVSRGFRRPSMTLALKLESASGGVLTARELRPDLPWPESFAPLEDVA